MTPVQFVVAIIGLIISIKRKNKYSRIGTVFFSLVALQFVFFVIQMVVISTLMKDMGLNGTFDKAMFDFYSYLTSIPVAVLRVASLITIIVGVVRYSE